MGAVPLEDHNRLARQLADLRGMARSQVERRELQRHERCVEGDNPGGKEPPDLVQGGDGLRDPAQAGGHGRLEPAEPHPVELDVEGQG